MPPKLFGGGGDATATNQTDIEAKIDILDANVDELVLRAEAEAGSDATTVVCTVLADYGEKYFNTGWWIYIIQDAAGGQAAPEGEWRKITNYVDTGTFTTEAFSAAVGVGDYFMVVKDEFIVKSGEHQTPAVLEVTAGTVVQNTWYTILTTTTPGVLHKAGLASQTNQEDIVLEVTLDGVLYSGVAAGVAGTRYEGYPYIDDALLTNQIAFTSSTSITGVNWPYKTLLVRMRKTSINGAGALTGWVQYASNKP